MSTKSEVSNSASGRGGHYTMPLYRKLLLSAMLTGNDAAVSFEQLYQVPLLQVLGVPITYVSFTAIVSGPLAMMLMNVLGYLSDKGQHHRQKKVAMVVFNSFLILTGLVILIWANVLMVYGKATGMNDTVVRDNLLTEVFHENNPSVNLSFNPENLSFTENAGNLRLRENPTTKLLRECRKGRVGSPHQCAPREQDDTLACRGRVQLSVHAHDSSPGSAGVLPAGHGVRPQHGGHPDLRAGLQQPPGAHPSAGHGSGDGGGRGVHHHPPGHCRHFGYLELGGQDRGEGERSQVGRAIAVVTCMIPLNYATLFFISGPLITLTNEDSAPLLLASASAFLAMLIFLLYKS